MYYIGYDIGSSSIKAALTDARTGKVEAVVQYPDKEMPIISLRSGWGEQHPELWWENVCKATSKLISESGIASSAIKGIGISYQMHGLVLIDKDHKILRPSIIWCDSRAVETGNELFEQAGAHKCVERLLNSPGNFTLSKLKWVKDNEPELYHRIYKFMLPGDYIALKLTGLPLTTPSGLSEGILWDFLDDAPANWLLEQAGIDPALIPELRPNFSEQGRVSPAASAECGLPAGIPVLYRAGDQPNNALSLNVLEPGEVAATGGTSGVVYAITENRTTREATRINSFLNVNHEKDTPRVGKMLCINGTGIQYSWIRNQLTDGLSYNRMNELASQVSVGSDGLRILPFGNGAERMLENRSGGASMLNLNFNIHRKEHLFRAALEGIAFSFVYGLEILKRDQVDLTIIKAGNDNLFRAEIFSNTLSTLTGSRIDIVETTGAVGAARAAAYANGEYKDFSEAVSTDKLQCSYEPQDDKNIYLEAYQSWKQSLVDYLN